MTGRYDPEKDPSASWPPILQFLLVIMRNRILFRRMMCVLVLFVGAFIVLAATALALEFHATLHAAMWLRVAVPAVSATGISGLTVWLRSIRRKRKRRAAALAARSSRSSAEGLPKASSDERERNVGGPGEQD